MALDEANGLYYGFVEDEVVILYSLKTEIVVRCDLDGKILDNKLGDLQTVLYSSCFAYGDGWIYYSPSWSGELHKVLADGSNDTVIYRGSEILDMCYYYGWLLVVTGDTQEGTTGSFMIDKDGNDNIISVGASRTGDGYLYEYSDGGVKLVGYEGEESDVVIPATVYGMEVVSVEWSSILNDQANFYILNEDVQYMLMKESELTWEESEDGSGVVITSYSGEATGSCEWVAIPSEIDGQTVVAIGDEAMQNLGVKGIFLPEGLVEIGMDAFADCDSLVNIIFPETLTTIARGAFVFCASLKSVVLPDSLETLGVHAFAFDTALEVVYIPANLSSVSGMNPFYGCPLLSISISDENTSFQVIDGVLFTADGRELVSYPAGSTATSYTVPEGAKVIGNAAFHGAQNLETVILPEGLQTVTANAFMNCSALESINIPDSVTTVGALSFSGCSSLTEISVPSGAQVSEDVGVSVTYR
ncbi:MAG: leucine-rich repeat domain-containing protein [Lachnospiraceae bacterium]|nr:leucine-rich repeat domain-containing protein [Lachnospiraceae bacterium]